ncbi:hypothetical protein LWI29_003687 [Acer saccharum]|uniref:AIPP2-like SPOC-like domain-containing protein n=1 Tax=Acer saccharum TaxID=4024 RepID=A0AA39TAZ6_ACESA|nr:hypothetical protein LWI29_003687 [Acer saccharum]
MRKQISFPHDKNRVHIESFLDQVKQSRGDDCLTASFGNQELRKQKRRLLLLDDGDKSDEESEPVKLTESSQLASTVSDGPLNTSSHLQSLESEKYADKSVEESSESNFANFTMTVCQKCGDKGFMKDLIYCVNCKVSAEHQYCLDILPKSKTEKVVWTCEECGAKEDKLSPVSSKKSERISRAEVRLSRKKFRGDDCLMSDEEYKKILAIAASFGDDLEHLSTFGNQKFIDRMILLLLEDGDKFNEESEPVKLTKASQLVSTVSDGKLNTSSHLLSLEYERCADKSDEETEPVKLTEASQVASTVSDGKLNTSSHLLSSEYDKYADKSDEETKPVKLTEASQVFSTVSDGPLNTSSHLLSLESEKYAHSQPMNDPIWRGCFKINSVKYETSVGLVAHLTRRGWPRGCDAVPVTSLPLQLTVEISSKSDVWPQRFQISAPSVDSIVLYFFPEYESDEKVFDALLDDMIDKDLALKATTKDAELFVFSSLKLPIDHWRKLNNLICCSTFM